jgi:hypothetical protein
LSGPPQSRKQYAILQSCNAIGLREGDHETARFLT